MAQMMPFLMQSFNRTNGKHDPQHRPSVNRVPGSINSKNNQEVTIIQQWNRYRPAIQYMLREFRTHLIQEQLDSIIEGQTPGKVKARQKPGTNRYLNTNDTIGWIKGLLNIPIADYRKYCIWRILAPYLMNIKTLSEVEAFTLIMDWLDKCNEMVRLSFCPGPRVRQDIRSAKRVRVSYYPVSLNNLQKENADLYNLVRQ